MRSEKSVSQTHLRLISAFGGFESSFSRRSFRTCQSADNDICLTVVRFSCWSCHPVMHYTKQQLFSFTKKHSFKKSFKTAVSVKPAAKKLVLFVCKFFEKLGKIFKWEKAPSNYCRIPHCEPKTGHEYHDRDSLLTIDEERTTCESLGEQAEQ